MKIILRACDKCDGRIVPRKHTNGARYGGTVILHWPPQGWCWRCYFRERAYLERGLRVKRRRELRRQKRAERIAKQLQGAA